MAIAILNVERSRQRRADDMRRAAWRDLSSRRRQYLAMFGVLAPLTGLAGPLFIVPAAGALGWVLTGAGLLACVGLLFYLAKLDADLSMYGTMPAVRAAPARAGKTVALRGGKRASRYRLAG